MDEFLTGLILGAISTLSLIVTLLVYSETGLMKEAYDRGYAVECVGKEGYYWECDNE